MFLIYANSEETLQCIKERKRYITWDSAIVMTRNYQFYEDNKHDIRIIFIEGSVPLLEAEAQKIILEYNRKIHQLLIERPWVYELDTKIEGGVPQSIADVVYYVRMYMDLLHNYINEIESIIVGIDQESWLDYKVLKLIGLKYGKDIYPVYILPPIKEKFHWGSGFFWKKIRDIKWKINVIFSYNQQMRNNFKKGTVFADEKYECGILFQSNSIKHFNWKIDMICAISDIAKTNVICFDDNLLKKFEERGITVVDISKIRIDRKKIRSVMTCHFQNVKIIKNMLQNFEVFSYGIDISSLIQDIFTQYTVNNCASNMIYDILLEEYLKHHKYEVVRRWISYDNIMTSFYMHSREDNTRFFSTRDTADFLDSVILFNTYPNESKINFVILMGNRADFLVKNKYEKLGYGSKYYLFHNYLDVFSSVEEPVLSIGKIIKILWAPSYPYEGYGSVAKYEYINNYIISHLCNRTDIELYVKYHPGESEERIKKIREKYESRIKLIDKREAFETIVKEVDCVIASVSTTIFDCIRCMKPVICIEHFLVFKLSDMYKEAVPSFDDPKNLLIYIEQIIENPLLLQEILKTEFEMLRKQQAPKGFDINREIAKIVRNEIDKRG